MASDGEYGVDLTIQMSISVSLIIDAEDGEEAHNKAITLADKITDQVEYRLNETLKKTKDAIPQLDDLTEVTCDDSSVDEVEEITAPVTDEEEAE